MADCNFPYRGSSVYNAPPTDDWSKPSYASDHVCRPVIVDAEGRKRPIVSYGAQNNSEFYVTRTERIVQEQVLSPFASEHKHTPYRSSDPVEGYGFVEERWQKPSSPVDNHPHKVDEFLTKVQTEASKPRFGPFSPSNWRHTNKPAGFSGNTGGYSDYNDSQKPGGNDEYFGKHSSPMEPYKATNGGWGRPSHTTWDGASPNSTYYTEPVKPSHTTAPHFRYTEPAYRETTDIRESTPMEPTMTTHGGWNRPSQSTWASPPNSTLSKPTNDINTAIGILKEVAKPSFSPAPHSKQTNNIGRTAMGILKEVVQPSLSSAPNSQYSDPGYKETNHNTEAARRYKFNFPSRPYTKEDNYTTTLDSREAARKYHGTAV